MKIVEVTWVDARHHFGPICEAELDLGKPITTVGYLVKSNKELVAVTMELTSEGYRNVTVIPRSIVKRVREIER